MIDALPAPIAYVDAAQRMTMANAAYRAWFGDVRGKQLCDVMPSYEAIRSHVEAALGGARVTFEACMTFLDGTQHWVQAQYIPEVTDGTVHGFIVQLISIDDRKVAEERLALLTTASEVLASSVGHGATVQAIASVPVPALAEWTVVYLDRYGMLTPSEVAHASTLTSEDVWQLARTFAPDPGTRTRAFVQAERVVIPLVARGKRLGVLVLGSTRAPWAPTDLEMADELGRRGSVALDVARMFEQQRRTNDRLRELDRRKNEFLAIVGHELRNPLAPIITALDVMVYRGMKGFERECAVIRRQALHMSRLVDDLLDVSRITRGKIELEKSQHELHTVIAKAVERTSPIFEQRAHQLTVDVPRELYVEGDAPRLVQIFENLLGNAAKYTQPRGHVSIVGVRRGSSLFVTVADDGSGISPERLPDIFEPFVQGERSLARSEGGLGLGLALVRSLSELHGGKVTATSEGLGRGSQFTVELPGVPMQTQAQADAQRMSASGRLLIVDDNVPAAEILAQLLREVGYEVAVAHDAPAALAMIRDFPPDVALLDLGLPVMDGYELARHLRDRLATAPPRFVAVTGHGEHADLSRSREAGFEVQLGKPVDFDKLVAVLTQLAPS